MRVGYARSLQLYDGAQFTVGAGHVAAPLRNTVPLEVTVRRFPQEIYLRAMARGYWTASARII